MRFLRSGGLDVWVYEHYEQGFPLSLKNLPDTSPQFKTIHLTGVRSVLNQLPVAVVGSREASQEALERAERLGEVLSGSYPLATGLAPGVDAAAAKGALSAGVPVVGVRPWLLPPSGELFEEVTRNGCVVSHNLYRLHSDDRWVNRQFFLRNMLIALLSRAVVVVEARPGGGTMHMLVVAEKGWRPVYVLRPSAGGEALEAYEQFVKSGATPLGRPEELKAFV